MTSMAIVNSQTRNLIHKDKNLKRSNKLTLNVDCLQV